MPSMLQCFDRLGVVGIHPVCEARKSERVRITIRRRRTFPTVLEHGFELLDLILVALLAL